MKFPILGTFPSLLTSFASIDVDNFAQLLRIIGESKQIVKIQNIPENPKAKGLFSRFSRENWCDS